MKKTLIVFIVILAIGLSFWLSQKLLNQRVSAPEKKVPSKPAAQKKLIQAKEKAANTNVPLTNIYSIYSNTPWVATEPLLSDRIATLINPELFYKYEGSYTWEDFQTKKDDQKSFSIKSAWLFPKYPQAGFSLRKNPETGEYEIQGGNLTLPDRGVGISYEKDADSDETRTMLNIKKSF